MRHRVLRLIGGRRRRLSLLVVVGALAALGIFMITSALAVHDLKFQLDGDTSTACGTVPNCSAQVYDWDSLFNADGTNTSLVNEAGPFTSAKFVRDFGVKTATEACSFTDTTSKTFCTADPTTYSTGSKDGLNIGSGWECTKANNVNSKIDIMNAYSASYTDPVSEHKILYFGLDKNKDNGNNNVGFWFLQGAANCESPSKGSAKWTGTHKDGDVLVVSEFTGGGGVSGIKAYRWAGGATGCIDSNDNPNPKTGGCNGLAIGSGGDCKEAPISPEDSICATTNSGTLKFNENIKTKWLTSDATLGVGNEVVPPDFFEGGIDITEVFKKAGGRVPSCFNTFIGDTRSSQSLTATLFDYARGVLGGCKTTLSTEAGNTEHEGKKSPESIGTGSVSSGTDMATLTITGVSAWKGTLTWSLCGPVSTDGCDRTKGVQVTSREVTEKSKPEEFVSGTATLTSAGRYCWTAHFEPNKETEEAGVEPADDNGAKECFTVAPVTPTLTTSASCSANPCVLGSTLKDEAKLEGTASNPDPTKPGPSATYPTINGGSKPADGKITWTVYGPGTGGAAQCTTAITGAPTPSSETVSGDGTYGPVSYTTGSADKVGKFEFAATYPGEGPNTQAAAGVTCDTTGGNGEQVTVIGSASSSSQQRWLPNDRVVLNSTPGTTLTGTLTVTLYSGGFTINPTTHLCTPENTATAVSGQQYTFKPSGAASGTAFNTNNQTFVVGTTSDGKTVQPDGSYFWLIQYSDNSLTSPPDRCEQTSLTVTDSPPGS
jgi:hypothetical protein